MVLALASTACSPLARLRATPEQRLSTLLTQHPQLRQPDTIRVQVPYEVPRIEFRTQYVPVHDTVWQQRESSQLDTLINKLQGSLDSVQKVAARANLHRLLDNRPVLRDTLCFDTLGVKGLVWREGRTYQIHITRAAIRDTASGSAAVSKLAPCPSQPAPSFAWYDPRGWLWPWYAWLLIGFALGILLCLWLLRR